MDEYVKFVVYRNIVFCDRGTTLPEFLTNGDYSIYLYDSVELEFLDNGTICITLYPDDTDQSIYHNICIAYGTELLYSRF